MAITIAELWREGRLLAERNAVTAAPIAAAFMFLPQVVRKAILAPPATPTVVSATDVIATFVVMALAFVGQAAIAAIMLGGREAPYDVADALRRSLRLLPRLLLVVLMLGLAAMPVVFILAFIAAVVLGPERLGDPKSMILVALPVFALFAYVGGRLFMLFPVLVAENPSARGGIKRSWQLTAARPWVFISCIVTGIVAVMFLTALITIVAGGLLGLLLGADSILAELLAATLATMAGTAVGVIIIGASVAGYRHTAGR